MHDLEVKKVKIVPLTIIGSIILAIASLMLYLMFIIPSTINIIVHPVNSELKGMLLCIMGCFLLVSLLGTFILGIPLTFLGGLIYNKISEHWNGIQIKLDENYLEYVKPLSLGLKLSTITTILSLTSGILLTLILVPIINLVNLTQPIANIGSLTLLIILILNIMLPITIFITLLIITTLYMVIYNKIGSYLGQIPRIQLYFQKNDNGFLVLKNISPLALAINTTIINLILISIPGTILLIISKITLMGLIILIAILLMVFIITLIIAVLYNKISSKIEFLQIQIQV